RQTAEAIAKSHALAPQIVMELAELHHGELEGLPFSELGSRHPEILKAWLEGCSAGRLPCGESLGEGPRRGWGTLEALVQEQEGEVCVVSHRMTLLAIVCGAIGLPLRFSLRLEWDLASVSSLQRRPGRGWRLLRLNTAPAL